MALVTVQRSPSPSDASERSQSDEEDGLTPTRQRRHQSSLRRLRKLFNSIRFLAKIKPRISESYFAVKGAALVLAPTECPRRVTTRFSHSDGIERHLQSMFYLLRPQDTIKVAVKLEGVSSRRHRYMVVVSCTGIHNTEECVILGIDCHEKVTIGLVLPIYSDTRIELDGDGGFLIMSHGHRHLFKPISVQAMWSALQSLYKEAGIATANKYFPDSYSHSWVSYYTGHIRSDRSCIAQWFTSGEVGSQCNESLACNPDDPSESLQIEINSTLREIMMNVDLEEVTSKYLRTKLEECLAMDLSSVKSYVDRQTLFIYGQMDSASSILPHLYLGSEWNASNLDELNRNGVRNILNISREIDNFFPGMFRYMNVREYDVEETDLLKYWDKTYTFISKAIRMGHSVLIHCKMGVSRSAATTIAFVMKEKGWSLEETIKYVRERRSCIKPLPSFIKQLEIYQGIINASRQRYNSLFKSKSVSNLQEKEETGDEREAMLNTLRVHAPSLPRRKSWASHECSMDPEMDQDMSAESAGSSDGSIPVFTLCPDDDDISSRSTDSMELALPDVPSPTHQQQAIPVFHEFSDDRDADSSQASSFNWEMDVNIESCAQLMSSDRMLSSTPLHVKPDDSWIQQGADGNVTISADSLNNSQLDAVQFHALDQPIECTMQDGSSIADATVDKTLQSSSYIVTDPKYATEISANLKQFVPTEGKGDSASILGYRNTNRSPQVPFSNEFSHNTQPSVFVSANLIDEEKHISNKNCDSWLDQSEPTFQVTKPGHRPRDIFTSSKLCDVPFGRLLAASPHDEYSSTQVDICAEQRGSDDDVAESEGLTASATSRDSRLSRVRPDDSWIMEDATESHATDELPKRDDQPQISPDEKVSDEIDAITDVELTDGQPVDVAALESVVAAAEGDEVQDKSMEHGVREHYVKESIPWNPGTVKKQAEVMEQSIQRSISSQIDWLEPSSADMGEKSKPVQRSSSLKVTRSSRHRRSDERRKTCTPILSPVTSAIDLPDKKLPVAVYCFGDEEVPLKVGLVRKHTQDFENLQKENGESTDALGIENEVFESATDADARLKGCSVENEIFVADLEQKSTIITASDECQSSGQLTYVEVPSVVSDGDTGSDVDIVAATDAAKRGILEEADGDEAMGKSENEYIPENIVPKIIQRIENGQQSQLCADVSSPSRVHDLDNSASCHKYSEKLPSPQSGLETDPCKSLLSQAKFSNDVCVNKLFNSPESDSINTQSISGFVNPDNKSTHQGLTNETLFLIREIGSALLQSETKTVVEPLSKVKRITRQIESRSLSRKTQLADRVVIVDKDSPQKRFCQRPVDFDGVTRCRRDVVSDSSVKNCTTQHLDKLASPSRDLKPEMEFTPRLTIEIKPKIADLNLTLGSETEAEKTSEFSSQQKRLAKLSPHEEIHMDGLEFIGDHLVQTLVGKFELGQMGQLCEDRIESPLSSSFSLSCDDLSTVTEMDEGDQVTSRQPMNHATSASVTPQHSFYHQYHFNRPCGQLHGIQGRKVRRLHGKTHPLRKLWPHSTM